MSRHSHDETVQYGGEERRAFFSGVGGKRDEDERFLEPLGKASHDRRPLRRTSVFGLTRPASQRARILNDYSVPSDAPYGMVVRSGVQRRLRSSGAMNQGSVCRCSQGFLGSLDTPARLYALAPSFALVFWEAEQDLDFSSTLVIGEL